jgi:hypothetical protein
MNLSQPGASQRIKGWTNHWADVPLTVGYCLWCSYWQSLRPGVAAVMARMHKVQQSF